MDKENLERIKALSMNTIRLPVLALISQCYSTVQGLECNEISMIKSGHSIVKVFEEMFHRYCVGDGIDLLIYDDETSSYFITTVRHIMINSITQVPNRYGGIYDFPAYEIDSASEQSIEYGGTAEQLYEITEPMRCQIQDGWKSIHPSVGKPCDKLSPYDLCSCANMYELTDRLSWFSMYILGLRSPYVGIQCPSTIIADIYDIMSIELFMNLSMGVFANAVKLPNDFYHPFKRILARGYVNFHGKKADQYMEERINRLLKSHKKLGIEIKNFSMDNIRVISTLEQPEVEFVTLTTALCPPK